jgi:hypothetical protein
VSFIRIDFDLPIIEEFLDFGKTSLEIKYKKVLLTFCANLQQTVHDWIKSHNFLDIFRKNQSFGSQ